MRIGLFTDFYLPHLGGVETAVTNYARALKLRGHEAVIVCPDYLGHYDPDHNIIRLKSRHFLVNEHPQVLLIKQNKDLLAKQQFDIVHTHTEGTAGLLGAWYAKQHHVPLFQTFHNIAGVWWKMNRTLPITYIDTWFMRKWFLRQAKQLGLGAPFQLAQKPSSCWEAWIYRRVLQTAPYAHRLLVPSKHFMDELSTYYPSKKYIVLPNAVDLEEYKPIPPTKTMPINILWVSRSTREKRPLIFLEAIRLLKQKTTSVFTVDMIGEGSELSATRRFIDTHKLSNVTIHGGLPANQVREFYNHADVFALSSHGFDNQPMVIAEASAAGLPIVLSDERLADQVYASGCFVAKDASAAALAEALLASLHHKTAKSTKPIRQFAVENYGLDVLAKRLEALYNDSKHVDF